MQRGVSLEDCLPEQEAAPAGGDSSAGAPAAAAEAPPVGGNTGASPTEPDGRAARNMTADGMAADAPRYDWQPHACLTPLWGASYRIRGSLQVLFVHASLQVH